MTRKYAEVMRKVPRSKNASSQHAGAAGAGPVTEPARLVSGRQPYCDLLVTRTGQALRLEGRKIEAQVIPQHAEPGMPRSGMKTTYDFVGSFRGAGSAREPGIHEHGSSRKGS